jgi:quercetin dioxygenase-like cupin family protein
MFDSAESRVVAVPEENHERDTFWENSRRQADSSEQGDELDVVVQVLEGKAAIAPEWCPRLRGPHREELRPALYAKPFGIEGPSLPLMSQQYNVRADYLRSKTILERRKLMKSVLLAAAILVTVVTAVPWATSLAEQSKNQIVGLTADEVRWFTPPYYTDGRQRAQLFGDSTRDGAWVDRAKIPTGARVLAHTHPQDELVTVIEGTWYLGEGAKFDSAKLKAYPAGSFIVIPAGVPHFVAAKEGSVVVQLSGVGKFQTNYLEK